MEKLRKNKGITLIALVIIIIVLLILSGVAIATLTGENGILNQAGKAKDKTTEAESIERVQVEVAGSHGLDGTIDKEQLNKNLKNINGLTYNENALSDSNKIADLPATVTLNGYDIEINSNGEVRTIPEIIAKIRANPQDYYGKKVTNYKDDGNTYRIFYVDKNNDFKDGANTIYLKADDSYAYNNKKYNLNNYSSYDSANTKVREMNPDWAKGKKSDSDTKTRGESEFEDPNAEIKKVTWNINEQAAAYLCSPVNASNYTTNPTDSTLPWNGYYNSSAANYVIGGPSVEMYVKSYNQAYNGIITENTKYPIGAVYRAISVPGYIYTLNGTQSTISNSDYSAGIDSIDYQNYESMYCGKTDATGTASKSGYWWLASPSANGSVYVCLVRSDYAGLSYNNSSNGYGVSPLVSLKSSFIPQVEE